jgi:hypothetical protein
LSAYSYNLIIADDTTHAVVSFDPTLLPDNAQANGSGVVCSGCAMNLSNDGFQNSENLGFSFLSGPLGFNPSDDDTYTITLSALPIGETASDPKRFNQPHSPGSNARARINRTTRNRAYRRRRPRTTEVPLLLVVIEPHVF